MHIFIFFLSVFFPICFCECNHDHLNFTLETITLPSENFQGRVLEVTQRENIRIAAFYYLEEASPSVASILKDQVVPAAISYYQTALKVNRVPLLKIEPYIASRCGSVTPPDALSEGIEYDLAFFIMGSYSYDSNSGASARPCVLMAPTERPILGLVSYNFASNWESDNPIEYESSLYTTLHEMGHVLGLTPSLFDNFINPVSGEKLLNPLRTVIVNGYETNMLVLEPLARRMRQYFGCPTIEGAYLENQGAPGSIGSHFERRIFFNEFMTATGKESRRVSEFFLAVLEGSGWYTPNYEMAEPMFWGKGKGCAFLTSPCMSASNGQFVTQFPDHYCTELRDSDCTFTGFSIGFCGTDQNVANTSMPPAFNYFGNFTEMVDGFADNCPYYYGYSDLNCLDPNDQVRALLDGEVFGSQSMCFSGTLKKNAAYKSKRLYCLKQSCQQIGSGWIINIQVGNDTVVCSREGQISVPGYEGNLNCPNPNEFCITKALQYCPRGCMGRGTCINGRCVCNEGYDGDSCSYRTGLFPPEGEVQRRSYPKGYFHILAIPIGAGIIIIVVLIGIIVNKVDELKKRRSKADQYSIAARPQTIQPGRQDSQPQFNFMRTNSYKEEPASPAELMVMKADDDQGGLGMVRQPQMSYGETLRQQALRYNSRQNENNSAAQNDAISKIRGGRSKK